MGCGASRARAGAARAVDADEAPLKAKKLGGGDPRWDLERFGTWLAKCPCVRLGFLSTTKPLSRHQVPEDEWVRSLPLGAGIDGVQLFTVLSAAFGLQRSPDLAASELAALLQVLERASEDDLVWWDWLALPTDEGDAERADTFRSFTTYKAQTVVLPTITPLSSSVFERIEPMALLALSCFCQRVYNATDPEVKAGLDLSKFFDLSGLLMSLQCESEGQLASLAKMLEEVIRALTPVATDAKGFEVLVQEAQVAFIRAPVIKRWVVEGGPARRRQEIPEEDRITGRLPKGRIISLSHCWDATCNCDPTGQKMAELAQALEEVGATKDEDGVFIDYCSLPQLAPRHTPVRLTRGVVLPQRTDKETRRFMFALTEMSRMYAYEFCEVVVLKESRQRQLFPEGSGEVLFHSGATVELDGSDVWLLNADGQRSEVRVVGAAKNGGKQRVTLGPEVKGVMGEKVAGQCDGASFEFDNRCLWGFTREDPYEDRGWCGSEYSIARFNGRIANPWNEGVCQIDNSRPWPETVEAYEEMMEPNAARPVRFTYESDREIVRFTFYRVCFGMLHSFLPDEWAKAGPGGALPSNEQLMAVEQLRAGMGDPKREYYLYVSTTYPAVAEGDMRGAHAELLHGLTTTALACASTWLERMRYPVGVGAGLKLQTCADIKEGKTHCLVWAAGGQGWEQPRPSSSSADTPLTQQALLEAYLVAQRKAAGGLAREPVVVVVMPHGARRAAASLHTQGVRTVLWVGESLFQEEEHARVVLFGLVVPILSKLQQPGWWRRSSEEISRMVVETGRLVLGGGDSSWNKGGCFVPPTGLPQLPKWSPTQPNLVWVHNLAPHLPRLARTASKHTALMMPSALYESLKLTAERGGARVDLLHECRSDSLLAWLGAALPGKQTAKQLIAALYADEDEDATEGGRPCLQMRLKISDVGFLHELRDAVLMGTLEQSLSRELLPMRTGKVSVHVRVDRSQFAAAYEASVLSMDSLTEHQKSKLQECLTASYVHLKAPAGAGKTFVALNRLLDLLLKDKEARALFVARNAALCYFVVRWICRRVRNTLERLAMLRRLDVLFEPFSVGPQAVQLEKGRIQMVSRQTHGGPTTQYSLVLVDEAHHIYKDLGLRDAVEKYVPSRCPRMLLSDISQSSGRDVRYYSGEHVVQLTEVVRSSQRLIAGASAFQLDENKANVTSHHNAKGPPLKSFLFDAKGKPGSAEHLRSYAEHTLRALNHVKTTFGNLSLHDRVAIVVPDVSFATDFRPVLATALLEHFPVNSFELVSAQEAAASALPGGMGTDPRGEWLVLDVISAFDGLERLIVLAVGLDAAIDKSSGSLTLETRSRLYRALTRAHMLAVVVNEYLPDGWLEFLGHIRLNDASANFDLKDEMETRMQSNAADQLVKVAKQRAAGEEAQAIKKVQRVARQKSSKLGNPSEEPAVKEEDSPAPSRPAAPSINEEAKTLQLGQSVWDSSDNTTITVRRTAKFNPYEDKSKFNPYQSQSPLAILSAFDDRLVAVLKRGDIRLLRAKWLGARPVGYIMQRRQDLETLQVAMESCGGTTPFLSCEEAVELILNGKREVGALSYGRILPWNPDPTGERTTLLRQELSHRPYIKALFWDQAALYQPPRSDSEQEAFDGALAVMMDLYASAVGTTVLQIKELPPRPAEYDGLLCLGDVQAETDEAALRAVLQKFGAIESFAAPEGAIMPYRVKFASHQAAEQAAAAMPPSGLYKYAFLAYDDYRDYNNRGWCVCEEELCTELLARLMVFPKLKLNLLDLPPKLLSLTTGKHAEEVQLQIESTELQGRVEHVIARVRNATFTSKQDENLVLSHYIEYVSKVAEALQGTLALAGKGTTTK